MRSPCAHNVNVSKTSDFPNLMTVNEISSKSMPGFLMSLQIAFEMMPRLKPEPRVKLGNTAIYTMQGSTVRLPA